MVVKRLILIIRLEGCQMVKAVLFGFGSRCLLADMINRWYYCISQLYLYYPRTASRKKSLWHSCQYQLLEPSGRYPANALKWQAMANRKGLKWLSVAYVVKERRESRVR